MAVAIASKYIESEMVKVRLLQKQTTKLFVREEAAGEEREAKGKEEGEREADEAGEDEECEENDSDNGAVLLGDSLSLPPSVFLSKLLQEP